MKTDGRIVVTGSVAFDYLMTFPGPFTEHLIPDRMSRLSVSFLVDEMRRVPGGCGPNIAYGLALLGERPCSCSRRPGDDAAEYRDRLAREGVDVSAMRLEPTSSRPPSSSRRTWTRTSSPPSTRARWRGPGSSRSVRWTPRRPPSWSSRRTTPPAMASYAAECREFEIPFLYDPSQQVTRLSAEEMREGFRGAAILIVNDYEFGILSQKTGLDARAAGGTRFRYSS